jgi:transposase
MSDSVNQPRTFEVLTAAARTRRKPRDWSDAEKERLKSDFNPFPTISLI